MYIALLFFRNVSSDGLYARKRLRHLEGVVDSCMAVVEASFGRQEVNSKTVENVTCLLRNLSFDCEEVQEPAYFSRGGGPTLPNGQSHKGIAIQELILLRTGYSTSVQVFAISVGSSIWN